MRGTNLYKYFLLLTFSLGLISLTGCLMPARWVYNAVAAPYWYSYGPYYGKVIDAETGEPIAGADVSFSTICTQSRSCDVGSDVPNIHLILFGELCKRDCADVGVHTRSKGRYLLPPMFLRSYGKGWYWPGYGITIVKEGYAPYNNWQILQCNEPNLEYSRWRNVARLEPLYLEERITCFEIKLRKAKRIIKRKDRYND